MRRGCNAHRWSRRCRIQRIGEQVVVPEILVPAKQHAKVVPFILVEAQASHVIGIAAIAKVAEVEVVEQEAIVVERTHIQRVVEESQTRAEIHEGIVGAGVPIDRTAPHAGLYGLLNVVVPGILSRSFARAALCLGHRQRSQHHDEKEQSESTNIWIVDPRKIALLDEVHGRSILEKRLVEVGTVYLAMAQRARLKECLLAVE